MKDTPIALPKELYLSLTTPLNPETTLQEIKETVEYSEMHHGYAVRKIHEVL